MIFLILMIIIITTTAEEYRGKPTLLTQGMPYLSTTESATPLQIYCYEGKPKSVVYLWQSVFVELNLPSESYHYYEGSTPEIVHNKYTEQHSSWSINLFSTKQKYIKLDPFNETCIGIETDKAYKILLQVIRVDYWKVLSLVLGALLFFSANTLSKNALFYYICGISFGICASFLILIYFFSKLFPRRPLMYGVAVCGWTIGIYILELLRENLKSIFLIYRNYLLWYIFISGLVSFVVCYRWGPVTNERTRNLIQWSLQVLGLIAVLNSTHFQEAAVGQIVIIIFIYKFPSKWLAKSQTYWKRKFPPKIKRLNNDDYYHEGVRETSKALENLRNYCGSPECNQWKTVLKLQDVKRFASFVEGNSHLSDEEILQYESSMQSTDLTDDEDMMTDEEL